MRLSNDIRNSSHSYDDSSLLGSSFNHVNVVIEKVELAKKLLEDFISALRRGNARVKIMVDYLPGVFQIIYNIRDYIDDTGIQNAAKDELFSKFLPSNYLSYMNILQNTSSR